MNSELELKLKSEFSPIYDQLQFGFECDDGWYNIIYELSKAIYSKAQKMGLHLGYHSSPYNDSSFYFYVQQVKEKYGTLRFYTSCHFDEIEDLIELAEKQSEITCEMCGKLGKMSKSPWFSVMCEECKTGES
jgi:rubrerythrin